VTLVQAADPSCCPYQQARMMRGVWLTLAVAALVLEPRVGNSSCNQVETIQQAPSIAVVLVKRRQRHSANVPMQHLRALTTALEAGPVALTDHDSFVPISPTAVSVEHPYGPMTAVANPSVPPRSPSGLGRVSGLICLSSLVCHS
jgi:hypothetical protein